MARCISNRTTGQAQTLFEQMLNRAPSSQFDQTDIASIFNAPSSPSDASHVIMLAFTIANPAAQEAIFLDKEKFAQLVCSSIHYGRDPHKEIYKNPVFRNHFKAYRTIMDVVTEALNSDAGKDLKKEMIERTITFWQGYSDIAETDGSSKMQDTLLDFIIKNKSLYSPHNLTKRIELLSKGASKNAINEAVKVMRHQFPALNTFLALSAIQQDTELLTSTLRMNFSRAISAANTPKDAMQLFSFYENDFRLNGTLGGFSGSGKKLLTTIMHPLNSENPDREQLRKMGDNLGKILSNQRFVQEVGPHHFVTVALDHMKNAVEKQIGMLNYNGVYEALAAGAAKATIPKVGETIFKIKRLLPSVLPISTGNTRKPAAQIQQALQEIEKARQEFFDAVPEKFDAVSKILARDTRSSTPSSKDTSTSQDSKSRQEAGENYAQQIIREWREKQARGE
jgi:hypothetical protein